MFHGVGKLYFSDHCLNPDRCSDIIDRAPSIGPIDDVSSVKKIKSCWVQAAKASQTVSHRPWWPPLSHGCHGAPLLASPHTKIIQHAGLLLCAVEPGVGHHGCRCWPFRSQRVDRHFCVVVSVFLLVKLASKHASPGHGGQLPSRCLGPLQAELVTSLRVLRFGTSWWHDASRGGIGAGGEVFCSL